MMNRNSSTSLGEYESDFQDGLRRKEAFPPQENPQPFEFSTKSMDLDHSERIGQDFQLHEKINRKLSKLIPEDTKKALLEERDVLVRKKFDRDSLLTKSEERRLALLRWEIERIEDTEIGPDLDDLEKKVEEQENFARKVDEFIRVFSR
jgi:cobalamin biosynthesis protein CobT